MLSLHGEFYRCMKTRPRQRRRLSTAGLQEVTNWMLQAQAQDKQGVCVVCGCVSSCLGGCGRVLVVCGCVSCVGCVSSCLGGWMSACSSFLYNSSLPFHQDDGDQERRKKRPKRRGPPTRRRRPRLADLQLRTLTVNHRFAPITEEKNLIPAHPGFTTLMPRP